MDDWGRKQQEKRKERKDIGLLWSELVKVDGAQERQAPGNPGSVMSSFQHALSACSHLIAQVRGLLRR